MRMLGMYGRTLCPTLILVVVISAFCCIVSILPGNSEAKTLYVGGTGPGNYTLIQPAIQVASPGDTIYVYSGIYFDRLIVDIPVSIVGESRDSTTINNTASGDVIHIVSDWVNISGLNITRSESSSGIGVNLDHVGNCSIANNSIFFTYTGIDLHYSSHNKISGNTVMYSHIAIGLDNSDNNSIASNYLSESYFGFQSIQSNNNSIENNYVLSSEHNVAYVAYSNNNRISNNTFVSSAGGLDFECSDQNTVLDNSLVSNGSGMLFYDSRGNVVNNNNISVGYSGILFQEAHYDVVMNNTISGTEWGGIGIHYSVNVTLVNNTIINDGLSLFGSLLEHWNSHVIDTSNTAAGRPIVYWTDMSGGTVPPDAGQVILANCTNMLVENQNVSGLFMGILLGFSSKNSVANNTGMFNRLWAIFLSHSQDNDVINNTLLYNLDGLEIDDSDNNTVFGNNVSNSGYVGIFIENSHNNSILNNDVHFNEASGIYIESSTLDRISQNRMAENGIGIGGQYLEEWNTHVIDATNSVNGGPVHYWKNTTGGAVPSDAGQVIVVNCTGTIVENQNIARGSGGVDVAFSSGIRIANNTFSDGASGIMLYESHRSVAENNIAISTSGSSILLSHSSNNSILQNTATGGREGLYLRFSDDNLIRGNIFSLSGRNGIYFYWSNERNTLADNTVTFNDENGLCLEGGDDGNIIVNNTVTSNNWTGTKIRGSDSNLIENNTIYGNGQDGLYLGYSVDNVVISNDISSNGEDGIHLDNSPNNTLVGNDITHNHDYGILVEETWMGGGNNTIYHNNVMDNQLSQAYDNAYFNEWDNGYPSGGNHWSDYSGIDSNKDGLGETPYNIDGGSSQDRYPLMFAAPYSTPSAPRNLYAASGNGYVSLSWDSPIDSGGSDILGYLVYRSNSSGEVTMITTVPYGTSYTDTGLENGQIYYYQVSAKNFIGVGPKSNEANATPFNEPPVCGISSPYPEETVNGTYLISGFASDSDGLIERVEVKIDDGDWLTVIGHNSWYYEWDTNNLSNGEYRIFAVSYDGEDYSTVVNISVVVDNPGPPPEDNQYVWAWLVVVAIIIILIVLSLFIYTFATKRKVEPEEELEEEHPPE